MTRISARNALAVVTLSTVIGLSGCVVNTIGAPCTNDDNCPSGQHCGADKTCQVGASGSGGGGTGGGGSSASGGGTGGGVTGGGGGTTGGGGGTTGGGGGTTGGGGGTTGGGGGTTDGGATLPQMYELNSAGARMRGGTVTMDLEVGHATPRTKMTGGTLEVTGAAAVQR